MKKIWTIMLLLLLLPYSGDARKKILFIGDSITDGAWGLSSKPSSERNQTDMNHIYGHGFIMAEINH